MPGRCFGVSVMTLNAVISGFRCSDEAKAELRIALPFLIEGMLLAMRVYRKGQLAVRIEFAQSTL